MLFYTRLPWPRWWSPSFDGIAAFAPLVGVYIGVLLLLVDWGLQAVKIPDLLRSSLLVALWVWVTGGLHLDGAMDTADGLAVMEPERRLEVMADSRTGAFGTMAAIAIVGLKATALAGLSTGKSIVLLTALLWGRWGQVVAIARYPYLRPGGKGALHKAGLRLPQDLVLGPGGAVVVYGLYSWLQPTETRLAGLMFLVGLGVALLMAAWFDYRLGGHTGDTYGAVVEWTETVVLCIGALVLGMLS